MRRLRPLRALRGLGVRPRQMGDRPNYTPEQTERYKSPYERLAKAQEIYANWAFQVTEEPISPDVTLYRVKSNRSPWGYWTVAVNQPPNEPLPPPLVPPAPPDIGGGGGGSGPINVSAYAGYIDPFGTPISGKPPGLNYNLSYVSVNGVPGFPYPVGETYSGGSFSVFAPGAGSIRTAAALDGQPISAIINNQVVWYLHSKQYLLNSEIYTVWLGVYKGPGDDPLTFDTSGLLGYLPNVSDPLGTNQGLATSVGILTPLSISGGGGGGNPDPSAPSIQPPPLEPSNPPANFSCDCPDWAKIEEIDPESPYPSRWQRREWVTSEAGCDVNEQGIGCKHTIAVALHLGIPFP